MTKKIKISMASIQADLDRLNIINKARAAQDEIIEKKISQGLCVASDTRIDKLGRSYCIGCECECVACKGFNLAYDVVNGKPSNQTALEALTGNGFTDTEARKHIDIFDELGIFTEVELFRK